MSYTTKKTIVTTGIVAGLGLAAIPLAASFAAGADGAVQLNAEVATAIAMKIQSPNDTNPDCIAQSGVTYGVVNRYATSNGSEGSKQVDTFDGTTGGADEVNTNTSCAKSIMTPNTYTSTYSDITVYTNSPSGYAVSLQTSQPNLVNVSDNTKNIPAGVLTESNGEVAGGQNVWSYKTDNGIVTSWTAASSTDTTIKSYDQETSGGEATRVTYGVSAGATPTGTYATNLTYTATIFDGDNPHVGQVQASETSNLSISPMSLKIARNASKTITVTPATGYYLSGVTCPADYTCSGYTTDKTDPDSAAAQTITILNNTGSSTPATISFTVAKTAKPLSDLTYMQDMEPDTIAETATGASKTLTDSRDNKTYTVKKLNDGNIWMTQNLRLVGSKTLTSADSNVTTSFNLTASNSGTWCTSNNSS
ncbi:hypothetical protein IJJ18_02560 [Candidatus Saccharibacteria bacterium]|nr:hypothetical protein [Candidatus Saccharibacteria bacterium]